MNRRAPLACGPYICIIEITSSRPLSISSYFIITSTCTYKTIHGNRRRVVQRRSRNNRRRCVEEQQQYWPAVVASSSYVWMVRVAAKPNAGGHQTIALIPSTPSAHISFSRIPFIRRVSSMSDLSLFSLHTSSNCFVFYCAVARRHRHQPSLTTSCTSRVDR